MAGYRVGELRMVFSLSNDQQVSSKRELYAFIHWFSPISNPVAHIRLHSIKKLTSNGIPDGGVIPLSRVVALCPLAPVLLGCISKGSVRPMTCMESEMEFYLNPFTSHWDYDLYA